MTLTRKQIATLRTLKDSVLSCKVEFINSYQEFYTFYVKMLDKYENFDSMEYPDRERLLRLRLQSISSRINFEKAIRSYFNIKTLYKEENDYFLDLMMSENGDK